MLSGKGTILDLGVTSSTHRYWLAFYVWSEEDMSRYDLDKEPPCPVWRLDPFTPIVPITFMRLAWHHGFEPWCVRSTEFSSRKISSLPPSLIICDLFPPACMRLPHGRFILPSNSLPTVSYGKKFILEEGLLDQYSVDYDNIVDSILSLLANKVTVSIGLCSLPIEKSEYIHCLKNVLQAIVADCANVPENQDSDAEE